MYIKGTADEGITVSTKTVETETNDGITVERHEIKFNSVKEQCYGTYSLAMKDGREMSFGEDYIYIYISEKNNDLSYKENKGNKENAHAGDYGLMIKEVK